LADYELSREKVPFEISTLKEIHPDIEKTLRDFKTNWESRSRLKDEDVTDESTRKPVSSLSYFIETCTYFSSDSSIYSLPSYNRVNPKRRKWIPLIMNSTDSNGDTLYGYATMHSAGGSGMKRSREGTGWISDEAWRRKGKEKELKAKNKKDKKGKGKTKEVVDEEEEDLDESMAIDLRPFGSTSSSSKDPIPALHPINSKLPYTVSMPVPPNQSSPYPLQVHSTLSPRFPMLVPSLSQKISHFVAMQSVQGIDHSGSGVWSKLRRIGPPSQLDPTGLLTAYEFDPSSNNESEGKVIKHLAYGFDWPVPEEEVELSELVARKRAPTTLAMPTLKDRDSEERERGKDWSARVETRRSVSFPGLGKDESRKGKGKLKLKREVESTMVVN
jgi:hypothetical protein